jgi:hypothetical protein
MPRSSTSQHPAVILRALGDGYVLWLQTGNRFLWLEEPAHFVVEQHLAGSDTESIARACVARYDVDQAECLTFVRDLIERLALQPGCRGPDPAGTGTGGVTPPPAAPRASLVHHYTINGKVLAFRFAHARYEQYLHPLLQHLESAPTPEPTRCFDLAEHEAGVALRVDGLVKGTWRDGESHLVKGTVFLELLNAIHGKVDEDWTAAVHASAVTDGGSAVLFPARPGSGKSTLAALLCHRGYQLLSDDFVAIDRASRRAFPFPAAMSVKPGARQVLAPIHPVELGRPDADPRGRGAITYVPLPQTSHAVPVRAVVFVKYDPAVDCEIEPLPAGVALSRLLDETWTYPAPESAAAFLDWFGTLACYRLTYSANEQALLAIDTVFGP